MASAGPRSRPSAWLIYGASLGVITFFLRYFGSLGDGVALAIVLGNCLSPLIDRYTQPRSAARAKAVIG